MPWWWSPALFLGYGIFWLPKILGLSVAYHVGISSVEIRAILLAVLDAARDLRGEARWLLNL